MYSATGATILENMGVFWFVSKRVVIYFWVRNWNLFGGCIRLLNKPWNSSEAFSGPYYNFEVDEQLPVLPCTHAQESGYVTQCQTKYGARAKAKVHSGTVQGWRFICAPPMHAASIVKSTLWIIKHWNGIGNGQKIYGQTRAKRRWRHVESLFRCFG